MVLSRIALSLLMLPTIELHAQASDDSGMAKRTALTRCEAIAADAHQSGLLFNPDGYRSFYERSVCLQHAALEFRDITICAEVRRRRALFSSSWGYSPDNCRELVSERLSSDEAELRVLREGYLNEPIRLLFINIEGNGNGRDYDLIPGFSEGFHHRYSLELLLRLESGEVFPLLEHDAYLRGSQNRLRLFLRRSQLLARFPGLEFGRAYTLEARLTLSIARRKMNGWLREDLVNRVLPEVERQHILTTSVVF